MFARTKKAFSCPYARFTRMKSVTHAICAVISEITSSGLIHFSNLEDVRIVFNWSKAFTK